MTKPIPPQPDDSSDTDAEQTRRNVKQRAMENSALVQLYGIVRPALFPLGRVVATPGAIALLERSNTGASTLLQQHQSGQWGTVSAHDVDANEYALQIGARLMSVYEVGDNKEALWIISEADRSATTLLLPEDY